MLIKNLTDELVNGTVGKVFGFGTMEEFHRRFDEDLSDHEAGASDAVLARQKAEKRPSNMKAKVPWVRWRVGSSVVERPMEREDFVVEDTKGQKVASRKQVSSTLANITQYGANVQLPTVPVDSVGFPVRHVLDMLLTCRASYALNDQCLGNEVNLIRACQTRTGLLISVCSQHSQVARSDASTCQS